MTMNEILTRSRANRAFIFDMDGTLVDNMKFHSRAWLALFESLGFLLDAEEFLRCTAGKTNPEILRQITGKILTDEEIHDLSERKETYYRELYRPYLKATHGLVPFLTKAKGLNIPMAVATSAGQKNIQFILEGLHLNGFFKVIVGAEDIQNGKPDPEIFLKSAQKLQVNPEDCIVFEDSLFGIQAASRAGMKAVFLTTSHQQVELGIQTTVLLAVNDFTALDIQVLI